MTQENEEKNNSSNPTPNSQALYNFEEKKWEIVGSENQECLFEFIPINLNVINEKGEISVDQSIFQSFEKQTEKNITNIPKNEEEKNLQKNTEQTLTEEEINKIKQASFEEGYQKAVAELQKEKEELTKVKEAVSEFCEVFKAEIEKVLSSLEKNCITLALELSKKLIGHAVEINPEYIIQIVKEALKQAGTSLVTKIKVSPQDMEFIELVGLREKLAGEEDTWEFEPDPEITSGCIVETNGGEIDFELDKAWERIKEEIISAIK